MNASLVEKSNENLEVLKSIFFDGRKDDTVTQTKIGTKSIIKEEHISVLSEPNSKYLSYFVLLSGSAENICNGLYNLVLQTNARNTLEVARCDETVTNTGWKNGVLRQLERKLGHPLQLAVCLLHFNELPFRALLIQLDGATDGPNLFTGPIGKDLKNCESKPVIKFKTFDFFLPDVDKQDLSQDQKYLMNIAITIKSSVFSVELV